MIGDIIEKALSVLNVGDIAKLADTVVGEIQTSRTLELGGNRVELEQYRNLSRLVRSGLATKREAKRDVAAGALVTDEYERRDYSRHG